MLAPVVVAKLPVPSNVTVVPPTTVEENNAEATVTGADLLVGTQIPFSNTESGGHVVGTLLFSMIIQRVDCLNICLPVPKIAWPLFLQGCANVEGTIIVNIPRTSNDN
jgi:hypothetical protein